MRSRVYHTPHLKSTTYAQRRKKWWHLFHRESRIMLFASTCTPLLLKMVSLKSKLVTKPWEIVHSQTNKFLRVNEASKGNCKFAFICCSATLICLHPFATVACTQCVKTQLSTSTSSRVAMPQPPLEFDAIFFFKCKLTSSFPPENEG